MQNEHLEISGLLSNFIVGVIYLNLKCLSQLLLQYEQSGGMGRILTISRLFWMSYHTAEPGPLCVLSSVGSESPPAFSQTVEANGFSRECLALTLLLQSNHNLDYLQAGIK